MSSLNYKLYSNLIANSSRYAKLGSDTNANPLLTLLITLEPTITTSRILTIDPLEATIILSQNRGY